VFLKEVKGGRSVRITPEIVGARTFCFGGIETSIDCYIARSYLSQRDYYKMNVEINSDRMDGI
jgi:hypothetical protein